MQTVFGEKVGAKEQSYMIGEKLHTAFYTKVEINGQMVNIKDESSPVGLMEAETRNLALKKGKEFLASKKA